MSGTCNTPKVSNPKSVCVSLPVCSSLCLHFSLCPFLGGSVKPLVWQNICANLSLTERFLSNIRFNRKSQSDRTSGAIFFLSNIEQFRISCHILNLLTALQDSVTMSSSSCIFMFLFLGFVSCEEMSPLTASDCPFGWADATYEDMGCLLFNRFSLILIYYRTI